MASLASAWVAHAAEELAPGPSAARRRFHGMLHGVLQDLARPARLLVAAFGLAVGVMLAGPVAGATSQVALGLLLAGIGLETLVVVGSPLLLGRAERRLAREVVAASAEIASGAVAPVPAIGRVVRRRVVDLPWWLPGRGAGPGRAALTVLTAVGDGPARRVAALVPADLGLRGVGVPAVLLLHPHRRDVAVLDDRVTGAQLAAVDADPRWRTEALPTDRTVVGGYLALVLAFAAGTAAGTAVGTAVATGLSTLVVLATGVG